MKNCLRQSVNAISTEFVAFATVIRANQVSNYDLEICRFIAVYIIDWVQLNWQKLCL